MSVVIDASVALKWVIEEPGSEAAIELRDEELIAPELWLAEAANALWRHVRLNELSSEDALTRMDQLSNAPVTPFAAEPLIADALRLAIKIPHPVCDCIYLALAIRHDSYVVTDDRRFFGAASAPTLAGRVRLLGA